VSILSQHWTGIEEFKIDGKDYQLSIEDVQAHERWVDEKQREISPPIGGLTLSEVIHNQHMYNIEQGMKNVFKTRIGFIGIGK